MGARGPPIRYDYHLVPDRRRLLYGLHSDRCPCSGLFRGRIRFFALPYTIIVYPLVFLTMPRLWKICRENDHVTAADFVQSRYASKTLALAVAITGIMATMPYIALQLIGIQVVIAGLGFGAASLPGAHQIAAQIPWLDT